MKQYHSDQANPEAAKERAKRHAQGGKKPSKKMSIEAMSKWHSIPIERLVK